MAYISLDLVAYCHTSSTREGRRKDSKELTYCQLPAAKSKSPATDYLTIPLTLLLLLELEFHRPNLAPQLQESKTPERFGEDVCELLAGFNELEVDFSLKPSSLSPLSLSFFSFSSAVTRAFLSPIKGEAGCPMKGGRTTR